MTFYTTVQSYVDAGQCIRWYKAEDASGGTVANSGSTASVNMTYTGASVTIGNAGPISTMSGVLVAGTDAVFTMADNNDADSGTGTLLFVWNQTGRTHASARWSKKGNFTHLYGQWDGGNPNWRCSGATSSFNETDQNAWSDSLGWSVFSVGWSNDASNFSEMYYGAVGGNTSAANITTPGNMNGAVTGTANDWSVFCSEDTSNRVTLCTWAHVLVFNIKLTKAQVDTLCTLAGTEPSTGPSGVQKDSVTGSRIIMARRRGRR